MRSTKIPVGFPVTIKQNYSDTKEDSMRPTGNDSKDNKDEHSNDVDRKGNAVQKLISREVADLVTRDRGGDLASFELRTILLLIFKADCTPPHGSTLFLAFPVFQHDGGPQSNESCEIWHGRRIGIVCIRCNVNPSKKANDRRRHQPRGVVTEPEEKHSNLLAEVILNTIDVLFPG